MVALPSASGTGATPKTLISGVFCQVRYSQSGLTMSSQVCRAGQSTTTSVGRPRQAANATVPAGPWPRAYTPLGQGSPERFTEPAAVDDGSGTGDGGSIVPASSELGPLGAGPPAASPTESFAGSPAASFAGSLTGFLAGSF